ncbi:MAG: putative bifunctional diguanylate cyclase/phosphodiesterase [Pseudonocardia sp.]
MVAARSWPEPVHDRPGASTVAMEGQSELDRIGLLARRWAELSTASDTGTVARLANALHKFATTLKAEPFWAPAARDIGIDLLNTGLCGTAKALAPDVEEVLAPSLGLLRRAGIATFGLVGAEGEKRLAAALDELAAGFAHGLRERTRRELDELLGAAIRAREGVERECGVGGTDFRTVYLRSAVGIGVASLDGRVLDVNPALGTMFGLDSPLEGPRPISDFVHPDDVAELIDHYQRLVRGEPSVQRLDVRFIRPDGLVLWTHVVASLVRDADGVPTRLIAVVEDVSERHRPHSSVPATSYQEQLTQLPNRSRTEQWLHRAFVGGGHRRVGMCALDLDGFTLINDGLGHRVGDQLLLAVAGRLQMVAGRHLVTRTGGDEFAVLVADPEAGEVSRLAERVLAALATPFLVAGHSLTISAGIGVAEFAVGAGCPEDLMRSAAVALSWAKARGGGRPVTFDPERDAGDVARFALLVGLRDGVDREEFRLAFQPLVRLSDGRVLGAEALVRWQHPVEGLIGPGRFIELAESSGAIVPLGRWVLEAACTQAVSWWRELCGAAQSGSPGSGTCVLDCAAPYVSVNVSPVQLAEPGWVDEVTGILAGTGLPPDRLQLEITEQAVLVDEAAALRALTALRGKGVRLALDDFGTGYSSLVWLRRLPVHALKIDGSFIDGLRHPVADPVDSSIVRSLVEMAHALGLDVTAEWVETGVQSERLAALGCDVGQGRWFGDAGPAEWVPALLRRTLPLGGLRPPGSARPAKD